MALGTILNYGTFTSAGDRHTIQLRSDVDFIWVWNMTQLGQMPAQQTGVEFKWVRGMDRGSAIEYSKPNGSNAIEATTIANGGFRLVDTSENPVGSLVNDINQVDLAGGQGNVPRAVTGAQVNEVENGDIVRLIDINNRQELAGYDYTVNQVNVGGNGFDIPYLPVGLANNGNAGSYRAIRFDSNFYPRRRLISSITQAQEAEITMTVDHGFTVGQVVRIENRSTGVFGMPQIHGVQATITAVNTQGNNNSITVDINSANFDAFTFPAQNAGEFTPAQVIPVGDEGSSNFEGAKINEGYIGIELFAGVRSPAGSQGDVIRWIAGKASE